MKEKHIIIVLAVLLGIIFMLLPVCEAKEVKQKITLRCTHAFSPKMSTIGAWIWWANEVTKRTDGRIQFKWYHGGALSKPGEEQEHVRTGVADMAASSATWHAHMKLWEMNGALPFQPSDMLLSVKAKWSLYHEFPALQRELEQMGQRLMFIIPYGDFHIISRYPLKRLDDLKGLKVAVLGRQQPKWVEPVGAIPIFMPGPARFQALEKGVIDASLMGGIGGAYGFRHHEVCKHMLLSELGQYCSFFTTINQKKWNKISPKDQKVMEELAEEFMFEYCPREITASDTLCAKKMQEEYGVHFEKLPEEDKIRWSHSLPNLAKEWVDEAANQQERDVRKKIWLRFLEITTEAGYKWPMDWSNVD